MKHIILITLLTGVSNVFVFGQELRIQFRPGADTVITLGPDRMPCVVSSLEGVERMPVKKLDSRLMAPMPNGMQREGWGLRVMPPSGPGLSPAPMPGPEIRLLPPKKRKWQ